MLTSEELMHIDFSDHKSGGIGPKASFTASHASRLSQVDWAQLSVRPQQNSALLSWTTESESDNGDFHILRSFDGIHYESSATVESQGPDAHNQHYEFVDKLIYIYEEPVISYRIRRESSNGKSAYSQGVNLSLEGESAHMTLEVSPGERRPLEIRYRTQKESKAHIRIINLAGRAVFERDVISGTDMRQMTISNQSWRAGIYYLQMETPYASGMKKFVVK